MVELWVTFIMVSPLKCRDCLQTPSDVSHCKFIFVVFPITSSLLLIHTILNEDGTVGVNLYHHLSPLICKINSHRQQPVDCLTFILREGKNGTAFRRTWIHNYLIFGRIFISRWFFYHFILSALPSLLYPKQLKCLTV